MFIAWVFATVRSEACESERRVPAVLWSESRNHCPRSLFSLLATASESWWEVSITHLLCSVRHFRADVVQTSCVMCSLSGGWFSSDWWSLSFDACRNIQWRWSETRGAGRLDSIRVVIVMMRSAVKQAWWDFFLLNLLLMVMEQVCWPCHHFTGISYQELDERLENDPNIVVCWKWWTHAGIST